MTTLARRSATALAAALLATAVGCSSSSPRSALPQSYPTSVVDWHHGDVDRVDFARHFSLADYNKVVVEPVNTAAVKLPAKDDNTYQPVVNTLAKSSTLLAKGLQFRLKNTIQVEPANGTPAPAKSLLLRTQITEVDPGSQAARYWVGYGAGRAETFLKGELVDASTNQTLLKFENAKASSWGLAGGSYSHLLEDELDELGDSIGILLTAFAPPPTK